MAQISPFHQHLFKKYLQYYTKLFIGNRHFKTNYAKQTINLPIPLLTEIRHFESLFTEATLR